MDYQALLDWMDLAEKLKCNTRLVDQQREMRKCSRA